MLLIVLPRCAAAGEAAPAPTREQVTELLSLYLQADARKDRIRIEEQFLELEKQGLTAELLYEAISSRDAEKPDRSAFTDRGKVGAPEVEWPGRRVTIKDLGWEAPDFYTLGLPRDYVDTGAKHYPVVLDMGEGVGNAFAGGADNDGVITAFLHPDAIPAEGLVASRQGQSLVLSVLADLPRRVRVDPDRVFLTGGGRTGNAVYYMAAHHPHLFAGVIPYSGIHSDFRAFERNAVHLGWLIVSRNPGPNTLGIYEFSFDIFERMQKYGAEASFRLLDEDTAQQSFIQDARKFVRVTSRDPWPRELEMRLDDPDHSDCYWLRLDKVKDPGRPRVLKIMGQFGEVADTRTVNSNMAEMQARVGEEGRRIEITTRNVKHLSVSLSPDLVDWGQEVEIVVDGETRWREVPSASLRTMLLSYRATRDPHALPWCRVQLLDL